MNIQFNSSVVVFDGNITSAGSSAKAAPIKPVSDAMEIEEEDKIGEVCREDVFRVTSAGEKDIYRPYFTISSTYSFSEHEKEIITDLRHWAHSYFAKNLGNT